MDISKFFASLYVLVMNVFKTEEPDKEEVPVKKVKRKIVPYASKEEILKTVEKFMKENGKFPTFVELDKYSKGKIRKASVKVQFGSMTELAKCFNSRPRRVVPVRVKKVVENRQEDFLRELYEAALQYPEDRSISAIISHCRYSFDTYYRCLGHSNEIARKLENKYGITIKTQRKKAA